MLYLRSFVFTSWLVLLTAFICIVGVFLSADKARSFLNQGLRMIIWGAKVFAGIKLNIEGLENLPKNQPYIIACKHQSAFDTLIFHSFLPDVCFLFKAEMNKVPFMGRLLRKVDCIPVDRKHGTLVLRKVVSAACECLQKGKIVAIFPEGTRVAPNQHIKYSHGVCMIYEKAGVPVVPAAINSGYLWPKNSFIKKSGTVTLRFLPAIPAGQDKKAVMAKIEQDIEAACQELPNPLNEKITVKNGKNEL